MKLQLAVLIALTAALSLSNPHMMSIDNAYWGLASVCGVIVVIVAGEIWSSL